MLSQVDLSVNRPHLTRPPTSKVQRCHSQTSMSIFTIQSCSEPPILLINTRNWIRYQGASSHLLFPNGLSSTTRRIMLASEAVTMAHLKASKATNQAVLKSSSLRDTRGKAMSFGASSPPQANTSSVRWTEQHTPIEGRPWHWRR